MKLMRWLRLSWFSLFFSRWVLAAACCIGGASKSFISLTRLQKYEVGTSLSYKEDYGRFNSSGEAEKTELHRTIALTIGAGMRLHPDWQIQALVPLVTQAKSYGATLADRRGVGDVSIGVDWTALEALFTDDWYPTIRLQGGVKLPTGSVEKKVDGTWTPGTGNGMWEPYVGVGVEKKLGATSLGLRASYTHRLAPATGDRLGNQFELSETVAYNFSNRLSLALGSSQVWTGNTFANGRTIAATSSNTVSAFIQPTFFIDRVWSIAATAEFTVPQVGWSRNTPAAQSFAIVTRYGFF